MTLLNQIKEWCAKPTPLELAAAELAEARRAKLVAETGLDYAESVVAYNAARISRLSAFIKETK